MRNALPHQIPGFRHHIGALLAAIALLGAGTTPAGTLRAIEQAYEADVGQVQLPAGDTGPIVIRRCPGCPLVTLEIDGDTTWHLGVAGAPVPRTEFIRALRAASIDRRALVYVLYRTGGRAVTRVILDQPGNPRERRP